MNIDQYMELFLQVDLNLEASSSGNFRLYKNIYKAGSKFRFIPDNYNAQVMGYKAKDIIIQHDYAYYDLFRDNQRLMSSAPEILFTQYIPYVKATGNVLLGGYGLGILAKMLCAKNEVKNVTSIEFGGDIIKLCGFSDPKLKLIEGDFYSYLKTTDLSVYDYIYIDTFTNNDDTIYPEIIIPLRNYLLENYPAIPFDFWQEDQFKSEFLINKIKKEAEINFGIPSL